MWPCRACAAIRVCNEGGWLAEGEISYAGPGARARARLAAQVLAQRLPGRRLRFDLIGAASVFADDDGRMLTDLPQAPAASEDIRLRAATADASREAAEQLLHEVTALYTCGPAGGGGVRSSVRRRIATSSAYIARARVAPSVEIVE